MARVEVKIRGIKEVEDLLKRIPKEYPRAMKRAVNKGLDSARTELWKGVRARYTVKQKAFYDQIKRYNPTLEKLSGRLYGTNKLIRTANFKHSQRKTGVRIELERGRAKVHRFAFIARMSGWHGKGEAKGVFVRGRWAKKYLGKGVRRGGRKLEGTEYGRLPEKYRLPILQLYGFSSAQMIDDYTETTLNAQEKGRDTITAEFVRQMDRVLKDK